MPSDSFIHHSIRLSKPRNENWYGSTVSQSGNKRGEFQLSCFRECDRMVNETRAGHLRVLGIIINSSFYLLN